MRTEITGVPETITVEGKTVRVGHDGNSFWAYIGDERRSGRSLADLRTSVASWLESHRLDLEFKRDEARARREELAELPTVYAIHEGERITVRGWSQRKTRFGGRELLVTMADGKKKSLPPHALRPVGFDASALEALEGERKAVLTALGEVTSARGVRKVLDGLRMAVIPVTFDATSDTFTGTYGHFIVTKPTAHEVKSRVEVLAVAEQLPWTVKNDDEVIPTTDLPSVQTYTDAWASRDTVERHVALTKRAGELAHEIRTMTPKFDYDAEVEKARAAQEADKAELVEAAGAS